MTNHVYGVVEEIAQTWELLNVSLMTGWSMAISKEYGPPWEQAPSESLVALSLRPPLRLQLVSLETATLLLLYPQLHPLPHPPLHPMLHQQLLQQLLRLPRHQPLYLVR